MNRRFDRIVRTRSFDAFRCLSRGWLGWLLLVLRPASRRLLAIALHHGRGSGCVQLLLALLHCILAHRCWCWSIRSRLVLRNRRRRRLGPLRYTAQHLRRHPWLSLAGLLRQYLRGSCSELCLPLAHLLIVELFCPHPSQKLLNLVIAEMPDLRIPLPHHVHLCLGNACWWYIGIIGHVHRRGHGGLSSHGHGGEGSRAGRHPSHGRRPLLRLLLRRRRRMRLLLSRLMWLAQLPLALLLLGSGRHHLSSPCPLGKLTNLNLEQSRRMLIYGRSRILQQPGFQVFPFL